jgi:hypothetical protein
MLSLFFKRLDVAKHELEYDNFEVCSYGCHVSVRLVAIHVFGHFDRTNRAIFL